jgi:multidrug efflux pump
MLLLFLMQFNSLGKSLIVLSSIFLSFFGVLISLLITGQPFGLVMCGIAIISLAGIVVDSNILFIETFKDLEEKLEIKEALLKTAIIRLKPILLASVTTIAGLIPMAFGVSINFIEQDLTIGSPSSAFWKQLASSIVGGLSFVVLLTLFITPSIIYLEETLKKKFKNDGGFKIFNLFKGKLQKNVNKIKFNLPR